MAGKFHHEELYRGADAIARFKNASITLCGAGTLGSNLADNLSRQGFANLRIIDFDRVEEHNINTQLCGEEDIGAFKVDVLSNHLFRSVGIEIDAIRKRLETRNVSKLLSEADVVIDTFDNTSSRQIVQDHCRSSGGQCLHVGMSDSYAEVVWDHEYRVPNEAGDDACDYPLARNIALLAVATATETLIRYLLDGDQESWTLTLNDFAIRRLESASSAF